MQGIEYDVKCTLIRGKWKLLRLDVFPFLIIYGILGYFYTYTTESIVDVMEQQSVANAQSYQAYGRLLMMCVLVVVGFLQGLTYILGCWSRKLQVAIQFSKLNTPFAANLNNASHVYIVEHKQGYATHAIADLYLNQQNYKDYPLYFFHFEQQKFYFNFQTNTFNKVQLPIQGIPIKDIINKYSQLNNTSQNIYDENILEMPIRPFWQLFREQIIDPFVFVQFFSAFLWLIDDNYQYSLMIIMMLLISAYTMTIQRIKTLVGYRSMTLAPHQVYVLNNGKWVPKSSYELIPGQIILVTAGYHHKKVKHDMLTDKQFLQNAIPFSIKMMTQMSQSKEDNNMSYRAVPCDILLLSGSCTANESIMTGEAIPQTKQPITTTDMTHKFDPNRYKFNMLYCGTQILQIDENGHPEQCLPFLPLNCNIPKPLGAGCIGMVVRTGFDTEKGNLIRKVLASSQQLKLQQKDALWILLFLLICSLVTSGYVLQQGFQNKQRDKYKLFLRCIMIITTVVPPELPMILTLSVNNSILYLQKKKIYVSQPKKLPLGGKVNIIAFDKTGTLTEDKFIFRGIVDDCQQYQQSRTFQQANPQSLVVLAGCHSLINVDRQLTGDPIELMLFEMTKWTYESKNKQARKIMERVIIHKRYPFKSELKRMSVVVDHVQENGKRTMKVLTKGAPETIQSLLQKVPKHYRQAYTYYTAQGYRLLCLASRYISNQQLKGQMNREEQRKVCQSQLTFAGFLICQSPLKQDTLKNIQSLQKAKFQLMIITGDNLLTAVKVGLSIGLGVQAWPLQLLQNNKLMLQIPQRQPQQIINVNHLLSLLKKDVILCTSTARKLPSEYYKYISIFARTSPYDKQIIVKKCKQTKGCGILYAGDGTNDVGALRMADVGIAVVGVTTITEVTKKHQQAQQQVISINRKIDQLKYDPKIPFREKMAKMNRLQQQKMLKLGGGLNNMQLVDDIKVGDACIAAPFTSKHSNSIKCVIIIIRQAITTLVSMIQTYKVLAISSILQAYALAQMNIVSLKYSHAQIMLLSIAGLGNYYYFSNAKPARQISHIRAPNTIFSIWFALSFFGQIIIFVFTNYYALNMIGLKYLLQEDKNINADLDFQPSFLNTVIVLFAIISQSAIFLINRGGEPHMESVLKNPRQLKFLVIPFCLGLILTMNFIPYLSEFFQLKYDGIPSQAHYEMLGLFVFSMSSSYLLQRACRFGQYGEVVGWL